MNHPRSVKYKRARKKQCPIIFNVRCSMFDVQAGPPIFHLPPLAAPERGGGGSLPALLLLLLAAAVALPEVATGQTN